MTVVRTSKDIADTERTPAATPESTLEEATATSVAAGHEVSGRHVLMGTRDPQDLATLPANVLSSSGAIATNGSKPSAPQGIVAPPNTTTSPPRRRGLHAAPGSIDPTETIRPPRVAPVVVREALDEPVPTRTAAATRRRREWIGPLAKLARPVTGGIAVLAVLALVGIAVAALVMGTWEVDAVRSGSMRPGFAIGGVVISERVPVSQLVDGDVIVFNDPYNPSEQIVHRIIKMHVRPDGLYVFETKGDANPAPDLWLLILKGPYAYRVRWSVPLVGYAIVDYENNRGLALLIAGFLLLLVPITSRAQNRKRARAAALAAEPSTEHEPPERPAPLLPPLHPEPLQGVAERAEPPARDPSDLEPRHATPRHATPRHATPRHARPSSW
jgi:signal peptidase